jgi:hypothetical protein
LQLVLGQSLFGLFNCSVDFLFQLSKLGLAALSVTPDLVLDLSPFKLPLPGLEIAARAFQCLREEALVRLPLVRKQVAVKYCLPTGGAHCFADVESPLSTPSRSVVSFWPLPLGRLYVRAPSGFE